ncbi:MAG TPA: alpha/beta fold hydrolase [Myxococcales bacterium]|nr:alpha/beta fold hydrolase [Myxococcales bacterium]
MVLVPYGVPPKEGWPVLAWSHGTSGVGRSCAPSMMKTLFYNWEGLYEYLMLGYAVVATDYAGLGTEGRHAYLDMASNGTDVVYSIPAAHAAVPNLSKRWVAIGHSQGGLSTLGVAQIEAAVADPNYLGAVALAGASDVEEASEALFRAKQPVLNGLLAFWVFGVKSVYPGFEPGDILNEGALSVYQASVAEGCSAACSAFADFASQVILKPHWKENQYVKEFFERNRPGARPIRGPVLLAVGGDDILFTKSASDRVFRRMCRSGVAVVRTVYPGLGHDPVVYGSFRDQIDWIAARFAGRPAPTDCASENVQ